MPLPLPGLRKATMGALIRPRRVELWPSCDYRIRQLFESADVMSEGAVRDDADGATYYGMTSIVLLVESHGGRIPDADVHQVASLIARDPHARLRAVRLAWREAKVRAQSPLGQLRAEVCFSVIRAGVTLDVDVEARIAEPLIARSTG